MIKTEELRRGNLVNYRNQLCFVDEIKEKSILVYDLDRSNAFESFWSQTGNSELNGIPLTAEWLFRLGFQKATTGGCYKDSEGDFQNLITVVLFEHIDGYSLGYLGSVVAYVHQLQNLYFALTGEELTLK